MAKYHSTLLTKLCPMRQRLHLRELQTSRGSRIHQSSATEAVAPSLMNEGTNEERLPDVDVRLNAGIVRSPLDEIKAIQTLLADVYKDAGDGRTLFRELVQNADDAGARRLGLAVLERGWPDAQNSLLCGPALLVANDGAFPDKDREALHKAIGGSKEDDVGKIGTFGIGLKSVFHICEAFLYMGAEESEWRAGVLNPWAGTGENGEADPLHPDWDVVAAVDVERLRSVTMELLGQTSSGLLLWIPLRRHDHLDRGAEGRRYGLGEHCLKSDDLCAWLGRSAPAALLLTQCGHLRTIDLARAPNPVRLRVRGEKLMRVFRQTADGWDDIGTTPKGFPTGLSRARLSPTVGAGPLSESRLSAVEACVNSDRSPIGRSLRSGGKVATPRCHGKRSLTPRSPCCGPATRMPSRPEHGFAGPCSSRWTTILSRVPVRSSKARAPRLPGRSSCTATSGRPRTADPFRRHRGCRQCRK